MKRLWLILFVALLLPAGMEATYSIVAWDGDEMGVAVQSHWYSVGTVVTWAEAGIGAVATQSFAEVSYGPLGLELLRAGFSPVEALKALTASDKQRETRQVAFVDSRGRVAAHTGHRCIDHAGHIEGEHFSVQANIMRTSHVWKAMAERFRISEGPLAERMIEAMEAAEAAGGDLRGRQSAAVKVVRVKPQGPPWNNVTVDIRVDDHPEPLRELRRIWLVHQAYDYMNRGDEALARGDADEAFSQYEHAAKVKPDNPEIRFWWGVTLCSRGDRLVARDILQPIIRENRDFLVLLQRLPAAGLLSEADVAFLSGRNRQP